MTARPRRRAGIMVGDELVSVDGAPYHEITSFAGKFGRKVAVKLRRRADAEPISLDVLVAALRAAADVRGGDRAERDGDRARRP